jgi:hypothetical protein
MAGDDTEPVYLSSIEVVLPRAEVLPMDADASSPAERAARAGERIRELAQRRYELAMGERSSGESVASARRHADEAMARAREAHLAAARRHEEAARVHERTANTLQRAAMDGYDGPTELQDQADAHWQAANDDYAQSVADLAQATEPEQSSSGSE